MKTEKQIKQLKDHFNDLTKNQIRNLFFEDVENLYEDHKMYAEAEAEIYISDFDIEEMLLNKINKMSEDDYLYIDYVSDIIENTEMFEEVIKNLFEERKEDDEIAVLETLEEN